MITSWKRIALVLTGGLLALEIMVRLVAIPRSGDLRRQQEYPARANSIRLCGGTSIALMGNSAAEVGVDLAQLRRELDSLGAGPTCLHSFLADGAGMTTWRAMLRHYFWSPGISPEVIVIAASSANLADETSPDAGRMARYLTSGVEWGEALGADSLPLSVRIDMLLSWMSATIAVRHRIEKRFRPMSRGWDISPPRQDDKQTFHALEQVVAHGRASGTTVLVVVFPVRGSAPINPQARALIIAGGSHLGDGLTLGPDDYVDDWHVTGTGRAAFTRELAPLLASALRVRAPSR